MKTLTLEQFRSALKRHANWLAGDGGERADFAGVNFASIGADLRSANLRSANLYGADLYGADLYGADLRSANLRSANLYGANLYGANLYGADLYGADLYGADLGSADLGGSTFLGCCLRLVGACSEAVMWVDQQDHEDLGGLFARADPQWRKWLTQALGGEPTPERLLFVVEYVTGGVA